MDIEKLKQKVLDLAIRGKLVPQDPNDEPASVLIEKIKKEKEELIKQGKIKPLKNDAYIYKGSDNCYYENKNGNINGEIPFDIPENWIWCRLGNIFEIGSSKRVHKSDWCKCGVPFYRARDIELLNNNIFKSELYISNEFYDEIKLKYGIPKIGDVLITAVGTLGKTYVIKDENPFYYKDGNIICLKNHFNINAYYIKLLFLTDFIIKQLNKTEGTTVNTYTIINANDTLIPLPSIKEQNLIVQRYNYFNNLFDKLLDEYNSLNHLILMTKMQILNNFFGENSTYKSYYENEYKLGDLLPYEQPGLFIVNSTEYNDDYSIPVLTPGKTFILGYTNEINGIYKVKNSKVIIFDDFTTAMRLIDFDFKVKSSAMKILHSSNEEMFNIDYLYYKLQTIKIISDTHKRFWISEYMPLKIKIHKIDEQKKIVKAINDSFTILDSMSKSI